MSDHLKKLIIRNLLGLLVTLVILGGAALVVYATTIGSNITTDELIVGGSSTSTITGDGTTTTIGGTLDVQGTTTLSGLQYPTSDGTNGQALTTNGSGNLSFNTVTTNPAGSDNQIQFNDSGSFGADSLFTWDNDKNFLGVGTTTNASELVHFATGTTSALVVDSNGNVGIGTTSPANKLEVSGTVDATEYTENGTTTLSNDISGDADTVDGSHASDLSPGFDLIATKTLSSQEPIEFTSGIDSTYDQYVFALNRVMSAVDNGVCMRWSNDGGSTYFSTSTAYAVSSEYIVDGADNSTGGSSKWIDLNPGGSDWQGNSIWTNGTVRLFRPSDGDHRVAARADLVFQQPGADELSQPFPLVNATVVAKTKHAGPNDNGVVKVNAVKFMACSGSLPGLDTPSVISLYGLKI